MEKKIITILEIIVLFVAAIIYFFKVVLPEYKSTLGSSDTFIKTSVYKNMFEINIDNNVEFALVLSEDNTIYHIMFYDKNATCLYNKNIEKKKVEQAVVDTIKILIENDLLKSNSQVSITRYENEYYNEFKSIFINYLKEYNINTPIIEKESTLIKKIEELKLNSNEETENILRSIDIYSKEFTRNIKNINKDKENILNDENSRSYTNNIYKKIEKYISENNITYLDRDNTKLVINLIPADTSKKYYPTQNSWYYVNNGKVYAYIELIDQGKIYGYCYKGSIDLNNKGECSYEEND